jgi:hypothetical protein
MPADVEAVLSQIEADAFKALKTSWVEARRTRKKTARAAGTKPTYRPFPTDADELIQGPWMQAFERRAHDPRQTVTDTRALRAFRALVFVRETRRHLADGNAHQVALTLFDAMLNTSMRTDSDLFRRPHRNASAKTNRTKREAAKKRGQRARDIASQLISCDEVGPRAIARLVATRLGVSPKTARRHLR